MNKITLDDVRTIKQIHGNIVFRGHSHLWIVKYKFLNDFNNPRMVNIKYATFIHRPGHLKFIKSETELNPYLFFMMKI